MSRDYKVYIDDILTSIEKIEIYMKNVSYEEFTKNSLIFDAVIRNLEIIGEAVKNLPRELRSEKAYEENALMQGCLSSKGLGKGHFG